MYGIQYDRKSVILCEDEIVTERQTLPSRVVLNMTQRGNHCRLVSNTTEMQTQMEVCEESDVEKDAQV